MKLPTIRKLPSGNYFCQLRIDGKSISITEPSEALCQAKALAYKTGLLDAKKAALTSVTLRAAIDNYIKDRQAVLSPSTLRSYRTIQRTRFASVMDRPINRIDGWQRIISNEAKLCSPKTLKNSWLFIKSVLKENGISAPNVHLPQIQPNAHPFLEPEQITAFIEAVKGKPCEIPALLALHSLRRSEIMGLEWQDIDLKAGTINVRGSGVFNEENKFVYKATNKNASSARVLPIMIPELSIALKSNQSKGHVVNCNPNTLWAQINAVCKKNNLPLVGVHGLRHSFASLAYHLGLSEQETMALGGWSDTQTMRKIYTHLAEKDRLKAENKLAKFFKNANENANENPKPLQHNGLR